MMGVVKKSILSGTIIIVRGNYKEMFSLLVLALVNGLVFGRGLKSSGAIIGVRTKEILEASSTSLATATTMGI